jgi:hypothetical protein
MNWIFMYNRDLYDSTQNVECSKLKSRQNEEEYNVLQG